MMDILLMMWEFFKTGLFAVGGGLATLPFLYEMAAKYPHWLTESMLADMIAVSESTPGPIGVNMATYVGFNVGGVLGGICATLALIFPSLVIILMIARVLKKYNENKLVQSAFKGLRPAVTGLISAAGFSVLKIALLTTTSFASFGDFFAAIKIPAVILFAVIAVLTQIKKTGKLHPIVFIAIGAVCGIVFKL